MLWLVKNWQERCEWLMSFLYCCLTMSDNLLFYKKMNMTSSYFFLPASQQHSLYESNVLVAGGILEILNYHDNTSPTILLWFFLHNCF